MLKRILTSLASLKLTITLMVLATVLIYAGTWAQIDADVWSVQKKYFHSFFTWVSFQTLLPRPKPGQLGIPGGFPMLGGYSIGGLILLNLIASHVNNFVYTRRKIGVGLIHLGVVLLLVGEMFTSVLAVESQMVIDEGSFANYTQDDRAMELAIVDPAPADHDKVVVIPASRLRDGQTIRPKELPFEIQVDEFYANSMVLGPREAGSNAHPRATAGAGRGLTLLGRPKVSGTEAQRDVPSGYVTFMAGGKSLGTYLVTPYIDGPQEVTVDGKPYRIQLRNKRYYKPYTIHLLDFKHDRYLGTDIPMNFSSRVRLIDPAHNVDREALIWMNHPLRYAGETFYQSSFKPGDTTTVLQVVRNPGWLMPYIACAIGTLGLAIHFGMHLVGFLRKQTVAGRARFLSPLLLGKVGGGDLDGAKSSATAGQDVIEPEDRRGFWFAAVVTALCAGYLLWPVFSDRQRGDYDLGAFGRLPISYEGRVQPLDSLARNSLRVISGRQEMKSDQGSRPAIQWLIDVFAKPQAARDYRVFRIDHPDVIDVLKLDSARKLFSMNELLAQAKQIEQQVDLINNTDPKARDLYQRKMLDLVRQINLYLSLEQMESLYLVPPLEAGGEWQQYGQAMAAAPGGKVYAGAQAVQSALLLYQQGKPAEFNREMAGYHSLLAEKMPGPMVKVMAEGLFNRVQPFMAAMAMYVLVFLLAVVSWLAWTRPLARAALWVLALTLGFHTLALAARIYIQGRPPVTNLYSSAVFIAWAAVILAAFLEYFFRNGVGSVAAATIGFLSLLVAHNLAGDGDTMKMLQAVLDTNFWLATHVITITLGYAATFLAGILAIIYVLRGVLTRSMTRDMGRNIAGMTYGIICFALLFSFVGTILGGIWADQSWGRFWGVGPKGKRRGVDRAVERHRDPCPLGQHDPRAWAGDSGHRREHHHKLVLVRDQHAWRRPAFLWLYGFGVVLAAGVRCQPGGVDGSGRPSRAAVAQQSGGSPNV
jgi:ABC-type transport system involved in cytochrome c biogenesis permease subunit